jgi:hypothetical protein
VFSRVFIPEVDRVGYKGSGDTTTVDEQTLLEAFFEHVPEICLFHGQSFFLIKSKTSGLGTTLLKCQIIRISGLPDDRLKEFYCTNQNPTEEIGSFQCKTTVKQLVTFLLWIKTTCNSTATAAGSMLSLVHRVSCN